MRYASYSKKRDYIGFFTAWHCIYYFGELLYCFICLLTVIWKLDNILSLKFHSEPFKLFPVKDWSVMLFCLRLVLLAHLISLLILNIGCSCISQILQSACWCFDCFRSSHNYLYNFIFKFTFWSFCKDLNSNVWARPLALVGIKYAIGSYIGASSSGGGYCP